MVRKTAFVSGAGVRLGQAIALRLAAGGYDLWLHYHRSEQGVQATAAAARSAGATVEVVQADLSDVEQVKALCGRLVSGPLDLVVNNAAIFYPTPTDAEAAAHWEAFINLNLRAHFLVSTLCREALAERLGSIVNIVDIHARRPLRGYVPYCIAKAGLEALTKAHALEFAPLVRVNGVSPGAALLPPGAGAEVEQQLAAAIPLGRIGTAEDIAEAVHYLAGADFINGQILAVDGGASI